MVSVGDKVYYLNADYITKAVFINEITITRVVVIEKSARVNGRMRTPGTYYAGHFAIVWGVAPDDLGEKGLHKKNEHYNEKHIYSVSANECAPTIEEAVRIRIEKINAMLEREFNEREIVLRSQLEGYKSSIAKIERALTEDNHRKCKTMHFLKSIEQTNNAPDSAIWFNSLEQEGC